MTQRTPEQQAIVAAAKTRDHLIIDALAGSGKTTTLFEIMEDVDSTFFVGAYNKSIATEIQDKVNKRFDMLKRSSIQVSTVHSHGLKSFAKNGLKSKILNDKLGFMMKDHLNARCRSSDDIFKNMGKLKALVSNAKASGFGLTSSHEQFPAIDDQLAWLDMADHYGILDELVGKTSPEEIIEHAISLMKATIARQNAIDFDDMIYLPLYLDFRLPQYPDVLIDEAQDINATRREMMFRSVSERNGRIIAVGDPNQAIYGFTGADTDSLNNIEARMKRLGSVQRLPLSICWRCDADIIASAQAQVPAIRARPNAPSGLVQTIDFEKGNFLDLPAPGDAILCRLNKPNVAVCLGLLRRGIRARIEGRDIGERLLAHVRKSAEAYAHQDLSLTILDLENYAEIETAKLVQKNKPESVIALLEDEIEAAILLCERCIEANPGGKADFSHLEALVADLFGDNLSKASVVLSSVHKSKGREWKRVFILGFEDYMPFFAAKQDWERVQERNLIYVAKTRAERELILVNGAQSALDRGLHRKVASPSPVATPTAPKDGRFFCNACGAVKKEDGIGDCDNPACEESRESAPAFLRLPARPALYLPDLSQFKKKDS